MVELFRAEFEVDGVPKAQPRAKATRRGSHAAVYDPGTADGWKALVAHASIEHRPRQPLAGPVSVAIDLYFPRPKRLLRRCDPDGLVRHVAKPDRDNCEKAILDALTNAGWWCDDAQVCAGQVRKWYHRRDGRPGAQIVIEELAAEL